MLFLRIHWWIRAKTFCFNGGLNVILLLLAKLFSLLLFQLDILSGFLPNLVYCFELICWRWGLFSRLYICGFSFLLGPSLIIRRFFIILESDWIHSGLVALEYSQHLLLTSQVINQYKSISVCSHCDCVSIRVKAQRLEGKLCLNFRDLLFGMNIIENDMFIEWNWA